MLQRCCGPEGTVAMRKDIQKFIAGLSSDGSYSAATVRAYRYELDRFVDFIGDRPPEKVGEIDVRMYIMRLATSSGVAAQRRALAVLARFFQWLLLKKRIQEDPSRRIARPPDVRRKPGYLKSADTAKLFDAVKDVAFPPRRTRDLALVALMLYAGARLSELVALNKRDIDLAGGTVLLGKGMAQREVPRNAELREILTKHLAAIPDGDDQPMFANSKGGRLSKDGVYYLATRYMRAAGIIDHKRKASPKTLRHTFCAQLLTRGANIAVISELAGYASVRSTSVYVETQLQDKRKAVELLGT